MAVAWFIPIVLSAIMLGAHFFRAGLTPLTLAVVLFPVILVYQRPWVARLTQVVLVLGALVWVRTAFAIVAERNAKGEPWDRAVIIFGLVAAFTFASALPFSFSRGLRKMYGLK